MLDARSVRENPDAIRVAMASRNSAWDISAFLRLDEERRKLIGEVEALQAQRNESSKAIGALMQAGKRDEAEAAKDGVRDINDRIAGIEAHLAAVDAETKNLLLTGPNLPDASVPVGTDAKTLAEVVSRTRYAFAGQLSTADHVALPREVCDRTHDPKPKERPVTHRAVCREGDDLQGRG